MPTLPLQYPFEPHQVYYAGDDASSKSKVSDLIRDCGFVPVDMGALRAAREIEDIPVQRFTSWKRPLVVSIVLFVILWLLGFAR